MDWLRFLRANRIEHATTGPKTTRGWVQIQCPFCGPQDPSKHMGVKLRGNRWHCWRNDRHQGYDPAQLIQQLLGCSYSEAKRMVADEPLASPRDDEIIGRLRSQLGDAREGRERPLTGSLSLEAEGLKPLLGASGPAATAALNYLRGRKGSYTGGSLRWLLEAYDLHYAIKGPYANRVVFPVRDRYGRLETLVGRSIRTQDELRYLAHPLELKPDSSFKHPALLATKETLLGLEMLHRADGPRVLVVCEGPFDAARITCFGRSFGVYATCLFGLSMASRQLALLVELRRRFPVSVLILDATANFQAFRLANSGIDFHTHRLSDDRKDPGDLSPQEVIEICVELLRLPSQ